MNECQPHSDATEEAPGWHGLKTQRCQTVTGWQKMPSTVRAGRLVYVPYRLIRARRRACLGKTLSFTLLQVRIRQTWRKARHNGGQTHLSASFPLCRHTHNLV